MGLSTVLWNEISMIKVRDKEKYPSEILNQQS